MNSKIRENKAQILKGQPGEIVDFWTATTTFCSARVGKEATSAVFEEVE